MKCTRITIFMLALLGLNQPSLWAADIGPAPAGSYLLTWILTGVLVLGALLASFLPPKRNG